MAQLVYQQRRNINMLRGQIAVFINENMGKLTPSILQNILTETVDTINQIETTLRHNNVRVRDHARLGIPALPNEPQVRKFMKRLENSVHVLCVLADAIIGGQGPAATQEELQAITNGEQVLDVLLNYLYATISPPSSGASGAETE